MRRSPLTTLKTMITSATANAAIITIVVTEMKITFHERISFTSIPVRPFKASALRTDCEPRNVSPGIEAVASSSYRRACVSPGTLSIGQATRFAIASGTMFARRRWLCLRGNLFSSRNCHKEPQDSLVAVERIEVDLALQWKHGFDGIDPLPLRKIELLLAMQGVQHKLQVGRRSDLVLGQLAGEVEGDPRRHSDRSRSTYATLTSMCT